MSRSRAEMIEETRGKLLATARESFRRGRLRRHLDG